MEQVTLEQMQNSLKVDCDSLFREMRVEKRKHRKIVKDAGHVQASFQDGVVFQMGFEARHLYDLYLESMGKGRHTHTDKVWRRTLGRIAKKQGAVCETPQT